MIELNTLEDIELLSESEELECKLAGGRDGEGQLPEDFWPTYSAMANTDGGIVLLSVREKKGQFSSPNLEPSSPDLEPSSPDLESNRDAEGKLQSDYHDVPFIDSLDTLSPEVRLQLEALAKEPRSKKKIPKAEMQQVILSLCVGHYMTLANLARLVNRGQESLRGAYLTPMCKAKELVMAFPDAPNHMRQAYTKGPKV